MQAGSADDAIAAGALAEGAGSVAGCHGKGLCDAWVEKHNGKSIWQEPPQAQ
jgi:hypothetical protein